MPRFKAVLFDLDGTLIEFRFRIRESHQAMIDFVRSLGYDVTRMSEKMKTQDVIDEARKQWEKSGTVASLDFDTVKKGLFKILDTFESEVAADSRAMPGSLEIMRSISLGQIPAGVVTNSGRPAVEIILNRHGFAPFLTSVITRNEMSRLKPSPAGLLAALEKIGVEPERSLYVGDSTLDIEAARQAKMKCASVSTGLYNEEVLQELEPDFLLNRIEDLKNIIL